MIGIMTGQYVFAPSILAADFLALGEEIQAVKAAGADWIHVDIMDGHFVPNLSMGPAVVQACRRTTDLPLDVHLMVINPDAHLKAFADAGASSLIAHVEATPQIHRTLTNIRQMGIRSGVALNPGTPIQQIEPLLELVDIILVMTVNPGYGGQRFLEPMLEKVQILREWQRNEKTEALISVDGGIGPQTASLSAQAGANVLIAGNAVFKHPAGAAEGLFEIKSAIDQASGA
jgi:ribulose-phosphate 3-epimerase